MSRRLLLEGRPGSGKTTAARRTAELLTEAGVSCTGFLTGEIRERGRRVGFEIETLAGDRGVLAHVSLPGPPRVGRYGVDLGALERIALPVLRSPGRGVVVVDELGKMELASEAFRDAVSELLERDTALLATVHVFRHPFTDALKGRPGIEIVRIARSSRDELPKRLVQRLASAQRP
jgi:nucleoside-triphosphatase